jgi:acetoin:2,6-dichlorophenolindophenol oxidoreductase subunit alpha
MKPTSEQLIWMYQTMVMIREFEETLAKVYMEGKLPPKIQKGLAFDIGAGPIPGEMHLATGQEPVAVGICAHLRKEDTVTAPHRPHHIAIAKGVPLDRMLAEMFGKVTGLCRGKGGHMHLFAPQQKFSCSGIEAAGLPQACGAALAAKKKGTDNVAVSFFGEGAANQGTFHESLNLAALWKLPVVFVCEDNKYAISVAKRASTAIESNADRAAAYGCPGLRVEHNDPIEIFDVAGEAISRARRGEGPTLIEIKTDRYMGHFQADPEVYRPKDEVTELRRNDSVPALGNLLRSQQLLDDATDQRIRSKIHQEISAAYEFARSSDYPEPSEALQHVFVTNSAI